MPAIFHDFDFTSFWEDSDYAREQYVEEKPNDDLIASIEEELGVRLPASYIELMSIQNGGIPRNTCYPTKTRTSWAEDHVAITGVMGIGRTKTYSLCGELGSKFIQEEWGYPEIGICICDCPSVGHDMIMLDYRKCGHEGEPRVVHVDQESDYKITDLAGNFESFIRGLVHRIVYDTSAEDLKQDLAAIDQGSFSSRLATLIARCRERDFGPTIRNLCRVLTSEKGYFALHDDEKSYLMYDIQFYLHTQSHPVRSEMEYFIAYPEMIAMGDAEFTTGGYAPDFIKEWLDRRQAAGHIVKTPGGALTFSESFLEEFRTRLGEFR